ncbi:MAG: hypothetical protein F8N37_10495 [Telmatospirillum sp.]|nr:hypothetical protein [Telmatospirillum sp.]
MAGPTPEQRADYLIRRLEQLIRDGRSIHGMSFKTWQSLARAELVNAFNDFEKQVAVSRQDAIARRLILAGVVTVVTVGFWGAVVTVDRRFGDLAAEICVGAGVIGFAVLAEIFIRRTVARYRELAREKRFERIEQFDRLLKRLEAETWVRMKKAQEKNTEGKNAEGKGAGAEQPRRDNELAPQSDKAPPVPSNGASAAKEVQPQQTGRQ